MSAPAVQELGDAWARAHASAVLRVPSIVVEGEHNYVLNPNHPDFPKIEVHGPQPFDFDPRLGSSA